MVYLALVYLLQHHTIVSVLYLYLLHNIVIVIIIIIHLDVLYLLAFLVCLLLTIKLCSYFWGNWVHIAEMYTKFGMTVCVITEC